MSNLAPTSPNFGFLSVHGEPLLNCAIRAERYIWDDANAAMVKSRQLAEMMARQIAARAALDPTNEDFSQVVGMLFRNRVISPEVRGQFDLIRRIGNEAAHEQSSDRQVALQSLMTARMLAIWFHRTVSKPDQFEPGPFRPPPNPVNVEAKLREELEALRRDADDFFSSAHHEISELEQENQRLQEESTSSRGYAELLSLALDATKDATERERATFEVELQRLRASARSQPHASLQSFIERSRAAARTLGKTGEMAEVLPLTRLRIRGPQLSRCCNAPMLLVQSMKGGMVSANCSRCNKPSSLRTDEFPKLDIWVSCPKCQKRTDPSRVGRSNYGYRCSICRWSCLLADLLPLYTEM